MSCTRSIFQKGSENKNLDLQVLQNHLYATTRAVFETFAIWRGQFSLDTFVVGPNVAKPNNMQSSQGPFVRTSNIFGLVRKGPLNKTFFKTVLCIAYVGLAA